jgi:hypothetical protein
MHHHRPPIVHTPIVPLLCLYVHQNTILWQELLSCELHSNQAAGMQHLYSNRPSALISRMASEHNIYSVVCTNGVYLMVLFSQHLGHYPSSSNFVCCYQQNGLTKRQKTIQEVGNRIHERTISLWFLGIILRVIRREVSGCNVYNTNPFQTTFAGGGGGG